MQQCEYKLYKNRVRARALGMCECAGVALGLAGGYVCVCVCARMHFINSRSVAVGATTSINFHIPSKRLFSIRPHHSSSATSHHQHHHRRPLTPHRCIIKWKTFEIIRFHRFHMHKRPHPHPRSLGPSATAVSLQHQPSRPYAFVHVGKDDGSAHTASRRREKKKIAKENIVGKKFRGPVAHYIAGAAAPRCYQVNGRF